jgi:hypothetical protein
LTIRRGDFSFIASFPLKNGEFFSVRYIHSVQKTPVEEFFLVEKTGMIELRETLYEDFGAGLPFLVEEGKKFTSRDGKFRITGYRVPFKEIVFRVGRFADYHLLLRGREIPFTRFESPGKPLRFSAEKKSFLQNSIRP